MPAARGSGPEQETARISEAVDSGPVGVRGSAPEGRPSYPSSDDGEVAVGYNLSDPQMEEALGDRISFRRFVGLGLGDDTPDHSTISRFRSALGEELSAELFGELGRQLEDRGMVLKQGTLMDATLVDPGARPSLEEGQEPGVSTIPMGLDLYSSWSESLRVEVHLGVDERTGLIRRAVFTSAKVYESEVLTGW